MSAVTCASALPVAVKALATVVAFSSIAARGAADAGSAATLCAELKKLVRLVERSLPVSADWMLLSHTEPAWVRARSAPESRTAADLNMSDARLTPVAIEP